MAAIALEDIVFTSIVTLLAGLQLTRFAKAVGKSRMKHKVPYPQMSGMLALNVLCELSKQNSLEFFPVFMTTLWTSSLFFNQVTSAVAGVVYLYSRHLYFSGYCRDVKDRIPGFKLGVRCLLLMFAMSMAGIVTVLLRMYTDIDLGIMFRTTVKKYLKMDVVL